MAVASGLENCVYDIEEDSSEKALDRYVLASGHWTTGLTFGVTKDEIFPQGLGTHSGMPMAPWQPQNLRCDQFGSADFQIFPGSRVHDLPLSSC